MPVDRAAAIAAAGHRGLTAPERDELRTVAATDPDPALRAVALSALVRGAVPGTAVEAWVIAARDEDPAVRRRAAELAAALGTNVPEAALLSLLRDADGLTAEAAAFAIGERPGTPHAVDALVRTVMTHRDALVREAAVAALGAIGDPAALPAVLHACDDKPAVRRRAVLALAAFEGDEVEARLHAALTDRDWQVRQAAEDLLS